MRGTATLLSAFVAAALSLSSATAQQLNPTVKVLPKPQTSVPPECEQGLAPAVPRVVIAENAAEQAKPARAVPPPSLDLKTQLRAVQIAAERGDRDAFKAALADARAAVAAYPPGGERTAANDVLGVYNDLDRLWDYQFSSPTGAFFDASTDFVSMMRRYPGYSAAIADQALTLNGQTVYPTTETRQYLTAEAARRLNQLGVRTPTRIVEAPPQPAPRAVPAPAPQKHVAPPPPITRKPAQKPAVRKAQHAAPHKAPVKKTKPPVRVASASKTAPQPRKSEPVPVPAPSPKAVAPAPVPVPSPAPAPKPQPTTPPPTPAATATTSATPALPTDTMSTTPPPPPETSATPSTTVEKPAPAQPAQNEPQGGRINLLVAIILIIVGVGVLIFLFRASD